MSNTKLCACPRCSGYLMTEQANDDRYNVIQWRCVNCGYRADYRVLKQDPVEVGQVK